MLFHRPESNCISYITKIKVCGVIFGCFVGMSNLLIIDLKAAERAKKEKELAKIMKTVMEEGRSIVGCDRTTLWAVEEEERMREVKLSEIGRRDGKS